MSVRDTRVGVRQALQYERTTSDTERMFVEMESLVLFFGIPALIYYINHGSFNGILITAWHNAKALVFLFLVAGFLPMISKKFRYIVAMLFSLAAPIASGIIAWNLLHDWFWTILIAFVGGFIVLGMNAGCLLWHEDMEATDVPENQPAGEI